jgi:hypothetical protein
MKWSEYDSARLLELRRQGLDWDEISLLLSRSRSSCVQRYYILQRDDRVHDDQPSFQTAVLQNVVKYGENWEFVADGLNISAQVLSPLSLRFLTFNTNSFSLC